MRIPFCIRSQHFHSSNSEPHLQPPPPHLLRVFSSKMRGLWCSNFEGRRAQGFRGVRDVCVWLEVGVVGAEGVVGWQVSRRDVWLSGLGMMSVHGRWCSDDGVKCQGVHSQSCFCSRVHVGVSLSHLPNRLEKQICIGVNKMDCDTFGEISNELKCMLSQGHRRADFLRRERDALRHVREDFE